MSIDLEDVKDRPETTLFMLMSVDGKISTGDRDVLDIDKDFPGIVGVGEGLGQYYELEQQTTLFSLNSGRVQAKIGINEKIGDVKKSSVSFIVIDNKSHLNLQGIDYFLKRSKKLYLITTNRNHPVFERKDNDNLEIIFYENEIDFENLFSKFKNDYGMDHITIQTGGMLNSIFLRNKLVDHISIVVAPCLIGGKNTSTLIDGESLHLESELTKIKALKLKSSTILNDSYLHLQYDVINDTLIKESK